MDFFVQQDKARSRTGVLVALFIMALVMIVMAVYAAVRTVILFSASDPGARFFDPPLFLAVSGVTLTVIIVGSLVKTAALAKGGGYIAESLGGTLLDRSARDLDQRRLLNVVEEMAIASGTSVPPVYLLDNENGINAFAAGFSPNDAVIGVTRGCCRHLNRAELQGVIAHEFSHILNGDMRLNIRLMGLLGGVMVIAVVGRTILRGARHGSSSSRKSGKGGGQIALIALLLMVIGYVGVLVGRLIQSAVCRQREYLADASAVQFTRSTGIAEALKKIGGLSSGSKLRTPAAGEASHLFISQPVASLFATHPPLVERIRRIEPQFSGEFPAVTMASAEAADGTQGLAALNAGGRIPMDAETAMDRVGRLTPENVAYSAAILAAIPAAVKKETQDILGAGAVACALLLDKDPTEKKKQLTMLGRSAPPVFLDHLRYVDKATRELTPALRLPVLDMAVGTLRQMSPEQFNEFNQYIQILVEADNHLTIFEFVLQTVIQHRLKAVFGKAAIGIRYKNITPLTGDVTALLTVLARAGHRDKATAEQAFQAAISGLPVRGKDLTMPASVSFKELNQALNRLAAASAGVKKTAFEACCQGVLFDGTVAIREAELLRAVAYALDIPLPPFLLTG